MRVAIQHMLSHILAHFVQNTELFGREGLQCGQTVLDVRKAVGVRRGLSASVVIGWGFGLGGVIAVFGLRGWRLSFLSRLLHVIFYVVTKV